MTENPINGPLDPAAMAARIAALEAELERVKFERDSLKSIVYPLLEKQFPYQPPTPEELHEMMHGPRGEPLSAIVAEYEAKLGNHGA